MSLSVDRGATLIEVLKWATYGAAFVAAAAYGGARGMARGLLLPLSCSIAIAAVTLAHGLTGATSIYGFYEPTIPRSIWHMGPLLNPNHLASYLNFGIFCGLGLLTARRRMLPTWLLGLAIAFLIPNAIVAGSRGGVVGLVVGLAVFFITLPGRRRADPDFGPVPKLTLLASLASVFFVAAGFTILLVSENTARDLYSLNLDKLKLLGWSLRLIADYPWFGVGRGAFEGVFAAYRTGSSNEIFTHPENLPAQWLGEWGVPVGGLALVAFFWLLRPRQLGSRWSVVASGAAAAVGAIFVQNMVDFGLEIPAVSLMSIGAVGVCWGHNRARRGGDEEVSTQRWLLPISCACVAVTLSTLAILGGFRPLVYERLALAQTYQLVDSKAEGGFDEVLRATSAAVLAHPAEPWFYRLGALASWRSGRDPMPWLVRALERGPDVGRTHLLVARVLAERRAIRQALFELRLAVTYDPTLIQPMAQAAVSWTHRYEDLISAIPDGEMGIRPLAMMARLLPPETPARERLLTDLISRNPTRRESLIAVSSYFVQALENAHEAGRCSGSDQAECLERATHWVTALERVAPLDSESVLLKSRLMRVKGAPAEALELLGEQCPKLEASARSRCVQKLLELAASQKDGQYFTSAARDYVNENCTDSDHCAAALEKVGDLMGGRGDWQGALAHYDRAVRERPEDRLWMKVARAGARAGAFGRVLAALSRVRGAAKHSEEYARLLKAAKTATSVGPRKQ